eukprot:2377856-Amphidinium_carterae.1
MSSIIFKAGQLGKAAAIACAPASSILQAYPTSWTRTAKVGQQKKKGTMRESMLMRAATLAVYTFWASVLQAKARFAAIYQLRGK